jgi:hypothetical protein
MPTGQVSTHAMHVVHDQSVSAGMTPPAMGVSPFGAAGPLGSGRPSRSRIAIPPD